MKQRADVALTQRGLAESREKAQALILSGRVYIAEVRVDKASHPVLPQDELLVRGDEQSFVSRGAHKLDKALKVFHTDVNGLTAMDIGAASGGFTDVLLKNGAKHVYAIDVGYGQLDWKLRQDERVTVMERTNARSLTRENFTVLPSLTVMDVSFISIRLLIPAAIHIMGEGGRFITLIKPQFEAGREQVGKHGVVREEQAHIDVLQGISDFCAGLDWGVKAFSFSPIKGPKGNIEFLADISHGPANEDAVLSIKDLVKQAHQELK